VIPAVESLRKILELEEKKGYQNTAVIGGLDKFLPNWSLHIRKSIHNPALLKHFSEETSSDLRYASLPKSDRREWARKMLRLLDELESSPPKNLSTQPALKVPPISPANIIPKRKAALTAPISGKVANKPSLDSPVTLVKGISEGLQKKFARLGVNTVRDLLYFFPHRHLDYSQRTFINRLAIGMENTIIANVWEAREVQLGMRRSSEATIGDETGNVRIVWFNQPYLAKSLKVGQRIVVSGRVNVFNGMPVFESPEWEPYEDKDLIHTGRLVPVYPLTQGLSQRVVRRIMKPALDQWTGYLEEFLPPSLKARLQLPGLGAAIYQAHYPEDEIKHNEARRRLAFDELFLLQLGVLNKKRNWQQGQPGVALNIECPEINTFLKALPYTLTPAQAKSLKEILADLHRPTPMSRLLQGEVGSGKTVVATAALIVAIANGYQGGLMAPTEILAEQHFKTIRTILSRICREEGDGNLYSYSGFLDRPLMVALLMGDLTQLKKRKLQERIASGEVDIVIGTHALIQKDVEFKKLGFVVVDEQHRFGVEQRSALRQKGMNPHVLVMTATPIPRTLALTLYGDLDLSVIDQLPPGRQIIKTKWIKPEQRNSAYAFLHQQVKNGRQAFIICPLVEESDVIQARAAVAEYERLSHEVFPDLRLGLLHGRMSSEEKEKVMRGFHAAELDILVSTPVVEVGIDVPNATVMLIESADRFGLSQLHQFRGRVGRGLEQSYCMLLAERPSDVGKKRLDLIEKIHNGFLLAEEDLKLRGPGEFFGTRQSGLPDLKMAKISDTALLELARHEASILFQTDPRFEKPENQLLALELSKVWQQISSESS
jgi:ATP-dependent DNA helicase RecG